MNRLISLALFVLLSQMTESRLHARQVWIPNLAQLFEHSELVLIADPVSTVDFLNDPSSNEYYVAVLTTVRVIHVLKGKCPEKLIVLHHRATEKGRWVKNGRGLVSLDSRGNRTYTEMPCAVELLFLRQRPDGRYQFTNPTDPEYAIKKVKIAFSPTRRLLGVVNPQDQMVTVRESLTDQQLSDSKVLRVASIAFSPDGRFYATGGWDSLVLWNAHTFQQIAEFPRGTGHIHSLRFSLDSRRVIAERNETGTLVWDLMLPKVEPAEKRLDDGALGQALREMSSSSAVKAWKSVGRLATAPSQAIRYVGTHLAAVPRVDRAKLDGWIEDLDSTQFSKRAQATAEITKLGRSAVPRLHLALSEQSSLETRRRLESLLKNLTAPFTAEEVLAVRSVELLERLRTKEAISLLREYSAGASAAILTREARASLQRIEAK
jgi:hypothetical protein